MSSMEFSGVGEKALELQAIAEWGVLVEQMCKIGYYGTPDLHPTTVYVLRMLGGWNVACQWMRRQTLASQCACLDALNAQNRLRRSRN
ncbi:MAG: hypothetical protein LBD42_04605 [Desulfovibrio sp.]|jgi:hypothetical protein|nr:hypothetical protein [Desulfovibrio sp.]